jgi:signal transduction histidine kinase
MLNKNSITKIVSLVVILTGLAVSIGWVFDISALKSIIPNQVTMKFSTAVSFVCSGAISYFISKCGEGKIGFGQIIIPISGLVVFLFMATLLITNSIGVPSGVEQLFVSEASNAVLTKSPGMPSIPTAVSFLLIVGAGVLILNNSKKLTYVRFSGYTIMIIGVVSFVGYLIEQPLMYYYVKGVNTGMAIHTGVLFTLMGFALSMYQQPEKIVLSTMKIQTKLVSLFLTSSIIPIIFIVGLNFSLVQSFGTVHTNSIIVITLVTAASVAVFSVITARSISLPITTLKDTSMKIAAGDFSIKASENSNDEIGQLSKSFNQMIENVIKTQRLVAIGQLSARFAHDIRNPLAVIKTTVEVMEKEFPKDEPTTKHFQRLNRSVNRIAHQIEDVLDFVRSTPLRRENIPLDKIVQSTLAKLEIPDNIKITTKDCDILINCDPVQMEVVLTNLILNSIQAINTDNGNIIITGKSFLNDIIIEVEDSGPGMHEGELTKIFEPLYTTKQNGTGLGLVSCRTIIEQHLGTISVNLNPTRFTIILKRNPLEERLTAQTQ